MLRFLLCCWEFCAATNFLIYWVSVLWAQETKFRIIFQFFIRIESKCYSPEFYWVFIEIWISFLRLKAMVLKITRLEINITLTVYDFHGCSDLLLLFSLKQQFKTSIQLCLSCKRILIDMTPLRAIKKYFSLISLMLIIYFGISIKLYVIPIGKLDFREKTEFMISFEWPVRGLDRNKIITYHFVIIKRVRINGDKKTL